MTDLFADETLEQLARKIDPQSKLLQTWPLKGGISSDMVGVEIEQADGRTKKLVVRRPGPWALKQNPSAARDEFKLLQLTQAAGIPTPAPVHFEPAGDLCSTSHFVLDYIEGEPLFSPGQSPEVLDDHLMQMATHLGQIHQIVTSKHDLSFLPQQATRIADLLRDRPAQLDQSLSEERIRETLELAWPFYAHSHHPNPSVLVHGDFWPGNLLWNEGKLVGVIDWEEAEQGDPMLDLAISRLDILWLYGLNAMHDFTLHYQAKTAFDCTALPYWELYAALRPASRLADWASAYPDLGREDITEEVLREGHRLFITQAFAKLSAL